MSIRTFVKFDAPANPLFWNLKQHDTEIIITSGSLGNACQTELSTFETVELANQNANALIEEKLQAGYIETTPGEKSTSTDATLAALEDGLLENPDDLSAHQAYANYLHTKGDPRGEYLQNQLILEESELFDQERRQLDGRQFELERDYQRQWLGELASHLIGSEGWIIPQTNGYTALFERGWLHSLTIQKLDAEFAHVLGQSPEIRLLRLLYIQHQGDLDLSPLGYSPYLFNLQSLVIDRPLYPRVNVAELAPVLRQSPRLETLRLNIDSLGDLESVFSANLPCLRELSVEGLPGIEIHLQALLSNSSLKNLKQLTIRGGGVGDDGVREIIDSGLINRLKYLHFSDGVITDVGARRLAQCGPHTELSLNEKGISKAGKAALQRRGGFVIVWNHLDDM